MDLLDQVGVLAVNRLEASMLTNETVSSREDAFVAARRLPSGRRTVIVTLGGDGLVLRPAEGAPTWIAPTMVRVGSTHGAGGTLAARLAAGDSMSRAASAASVAAARLVGRLDGEPRGFANQRAPDH